MRDDHCYEPDFLPPMRASFYNGVFFFQLLFVESGAAAGDGSEPLAI